MIKELIYYLNDQKIYGKAYVPDNNEKIYPTIILSHGLSLNHTYMMDYAEKLQKHNIAVYIFDFRGGGYDSLSDGRISDMTILTEVEDLNFVIDNIKKEDFVDPTQLYLGGHSQGGLISTLVAQDRNDIRSLFLFAPAYVIPSDVKETKKRTKNVLNLMPEYLGEKYINSASNIDIYTIIKDIDISVYIFQGYKDERVPIEYVVKADKIFSNSVLYIYGDAEHRFTSQVKDDVTNIINEVIFNNK